ncbi:MAG: hypothetical protein KBT86_11130 [Gammaproteobacteria bacterium]|nr:hypothetical protein [Gammaproteobacteria bacterium]
MSEANQPEFMAPARMLTLHLPPNLIVATRNERVKLPQQTNSLTAPRTKLPDMCSGTKLDTERPTIGTDSDVLKP